MDLHTQNALIIGSLAAILIVGWLVICFLIWRGSGSMKRTALLVLLPFSIGMSFVWIFGGLFISLFFVTESGLGVNYEVASWTFGLVGNLALGFCRLFLRFLPDSIALVFCGLILPVLVGIAFFFLLGLLPSLFVRRKEQQVQENQATK
jgi:hypothetical protein